MQLNTYTQVGSHLPDVAITQSPEMAPILDIRQKKSELSLQSKIRNAMCTRGRQRIKIPFELLYDHKGLQLFEQITYLEDYYPNKTELEILQNYADEFAASCQDGSIIVELGSGNLRKVDLLLRALDRAGKKNISYFALDLDYSELVRTLAQLPKYENVSCYGLWGFYEDGFRWLNRMSKHIGPVTILYLGSSIGNFSRPEARNFVSSIAQTLRPEMGDAFVIAFDHCNDDSKIWRAYHDPDGVHEKFLLNALRNANSIMGRDLFDLDAWRSDGEMDQQNSTHKLFYRAIHDTIVEDHSFKKGERMDLGQNIKYPREEIRRVFHEAGLQQATRWDNASQDYSLYRLVREAAKPAL